MEFLRSCKQNCNSQLCNEAIHHGRHIRRCSAKSTCWCSIRGRCCSLLTGWWRENPRGLFCCATEYWWGMEIWREREWQDGTGLIISGGEFSRIGLAGGVRKPERGDVSSFTLSRLSLPLMTGCKAESWYVRPGSEESLVASGMIGWVSW